MAFFKRKKQPDRPSYLLMDRDSHVLAKAQLQNEQDEINLQFRVPDGLAERVVSAEIVQAVPPDQKDSVILGKVIFRRGSLVVLEPLRKLGSAVRKHYRVPVKFDSYLYPHTGARSPLRSIDLSCGGIAFFSTTPLGVGEDPDIVIPITSEGPLIVPCEILRRVPFQGPVNQFGAKFINLIHDQEAMIQEAVFQVQMEQIWRSRQESR